VGVGGRAACRGRIAPRLPRDCHAAPRLPRDCHAARDCRAVCVGAPTASDRLRAMSTLHSSFPAVIEVVVEIPARSRNKYEYDEEARVIRLDRVLSSAVFYNFDYGFIEGTRADDGDHTDAMLLIDEPTFPGCHVWARPVGVLKMADEKGVDYKVLCVALADPMYAHLEALRQVSPHKLAEIEQFFHTYKNLEDKSVEIDGWAGVAETLEILRTDRDRWLAEQATLEGVAQA
jgi:inorganic pyrophosphatase